MNFSHAIFRLKNNFALDWENKDLNAKFKKYRICARLGKLNLRSIGTALDWHCARLGRARLGQIDLRAIGMRSIGHRPFPARAKKGL